METKSTLKYIIAAIVIAIIGVLAFKLLVTEHLDSPTDNTETPEVVVPEDWMEQTLSDGRVFRYPADLGMKYTRVQDWPPVVSVIDQAFTCTAAGLEVERAGLTEEVVVDGHEYCATRVTEGAAGSSYTQYAYARASGDKTEIMTFTIKSVQCGNYNEPEMNECIAEQSAFDIDSLVNKIFQTLS